jgi:hypothetical protein
MKGIPSGVASGENGYRHVDFTELATTAHSFALWVTVTGGPIAVPKDSGFNSGPGEDLRCPLKSSAKPTSVCKWLQEVNSTDEGRTL